MNPFETTKGKNVPVPLTNDGTRIQGGLFDFHNEFDEITVTLDDESPTTDKHGPFLVCFMHSDSSIGGPDDDRAWLFDKLSDAREQFVALVNHEFDAVLGEIEQD